MNLVNISYIPMLLNIVKSLILTTNYKVNLIITFLNITIFQGFVLGSIILVSPLFKSNANKYLAYAIFSLSILLLVLVFNATGLYETIPILELLETMSLELVFPIFIFLFIAHQVKHPIISSKRRFWLFFPFLYTAILNTLLHPIIYGNLIPDSAKLTILILVWIELLMAIVFIPAILIYAYFLIKKSNNVQEKRWLTYLWLVIFIIFAAFTLTILFAAFKGFDIMPTMRVLALFAAVLIHWVVYTGIYKFKLANDQKEIKRLIKKQNHTNFTHSVPKTSKVNDVKKEEYLVEDNIYFKKLKRLCIDNQIYRDSSLDREKVAEMLGISPSYVSQLVNSITGDNFSTFINRFRVEEIKELMLNPKFDNYSLLAIGLECGFSSKTTFHNSFKKITGMTPNAYKKAQK